MKILVSAFDAQLGVDAGS